RVILPIAKGPLKGLATQRTFFVGNVAGEEGHIGLLPGHALAEAVGAIHAHARTKAAEMGARMLVWKDFPAEDADALDALVSTRPAFRVPSYPGTSIDLLPGGYPAFMASMNSKRRRR